nr:uncharacterized protein LOC109157356 isoform X2 [Ipomoea batatas]
MEAFLGKTQSLLTEFNKLLPTGGTPAEQIAQREIFFIVFVLSKLGNEFENTRNHILGDNVVPRIQELFKRLLQVTSFPSDDPRLLYNRALLILEVERLFVTCNGCSMMLGSAYEWVVTKKLGRSSESDLALVIEEKLETPKCNGGSTTAKYQYSDSQNSMTPYFESSNSLLVQQRHANLPNKSRSCRKTIKTTLTINPRATIR